MGLDLYEINIPRQYLPLYQAGIVYLFPQRTCEPPAEKDVALSDYSLGDPKKDQAESYPPPWSHLWKNLRPPYTMVWTYWQLAQDLGPASDRERTQLLKTILAKLCWPKGSVAFWPISSFDGHRHFPDHEIFWSGVQELQAQMVVVFGTAAFLALFPEKDPRFGFTTTPDKLQIVHVPGPDDMLPDNREMKNLAWNMLCPLVPGR
jgi:hypothetical protein